MRRSIQWSLQLWHAALLVAIVVAFVVVGHTSVRRMRMQQIDAELAQSAQTLAAGIQPPPPGARRSQEGERRREPPGFDDRDFSMSDFDLPDLDALDSPDSTDRGERRPFDRDGGGTGRRTRRAPFTPDVHLPAEWAASGGDAGGHHYYRVWHFENVIAESRYAPETPHPGVRRWSMQAQPEPPKIRQRGDLREAIAYGDFDTCVVVGRSLAPERAQWWRLGLIQIGTGAAVLLVGLAGGWVISRRSVRPIRAMTRVAENISASNLSQRIDVAMTQAELRSLAVVLNGAFDRLSEALRRQVRFTADASHELRTPLSVIHTQTQLALSRERSAEEYRRTIEACQRSSTRMKGLVESLLLLARSDAGRLTLELTRFDLRVAVDEAIGMVSHLATERNVTIVNDVAPMETLADAGRIHQLLTNLLTNAVRYNHSGGRVRVFADVAADDMTLCVEDTGAGIPAEHIGHLFEPFYRVDDDRNRDAGGTGLGLAICKRIVDAHGGTITCESRVGAGSTFIVRLPRDVGAGMISRA
ncbi:MAG TPA: ATP-binding protein [Phycisphaerae bacterium]|nr:ATP-binding protein [Phycisphaerae bacterium]HRW51842.1 ATP-binding protein [Phycisphaerae bacterium]